MGALMEIDLDEQLELIKTYSNHDDTDKLITFFLEKKFTKTIEHVGVAKKEVKDQTDVLYALLLLEVLSYIKLDEQQDAKESLQELYKAIDHNDTKKLLNTGELASELDDKLARRCISQAVKKLEENPNESPVTIGHAYLLLAEIEERMNKLPRAIKYYQKGMTIFESDEKHPDSLIVFLYYKLGMLHATNNNKTDAIDYLKKGLSIAGKQLEIKINMLVSLGKLYGSMEDDKEAIPYLNEALNVINESSLANKVIHAEALTELGYYYFNQNNLEQAIPYYEQAITIYELEKYVSNQKLGMIYMQYAHCLENKKKPTLPQAAKQYENAIYYLEQNNDRQLYKDALGDVVTFFNKTNNLKKQRYYENKVVKLINEGAPQ